MAKLDFNKKLSVQKLLVGNFIEEVPEDFNKKVAYVWQGDGIWEVRKLALGTFTTHIHEFETPGLKRDLEEGWVLNVPKIPAVFLDITLSFFRQIYDKNSSEVFLQYFYDIEKKDYVINCPQQTVGPGSVNYRRDTEFEKGKILVFEIHSHGGMNAFFSGTDDADEKDDRFFGVIGRVKNYYPEFKIRLSVGGRKQDIDVDELFVLDGSAYDKESFPEEWIDKIKEKKVKVINSRKQVYHESQFRQSHNRSGFVYYPMKDDDDDPLFDSSQLSMFRNDYDDDNLEPVPYESGVRKNQKLVEKDDKIYIVTDTGTEEIWEEIEPTNGENNGESEVDNKSCKQKHWSDVKW